MKDVKELDNKFSLSNYNFIVKENGNKQLAEIY